MCVNAINMTTLGRTRRVFLILSVICCLFSNSWIITWISLEINTISFCAVLLFLINKETLHKESIMKYFIVQSVASALLLLRSSYEIEKRIFIIVWLTIAVLLKIGRVPFHQWFINVRNLLPLKGGALLITTQKILPIFLISTLRRWLAFAFAIINIVVGTISQYNTKKFMTIIALSSVANLGWLILASQLCLSTMWSLIRIYMLNVIMVFIYLTNKERKETNKNNNETLRTMVLMASLAGIPPLILFLPKWIISKEIIEQRALAPTILLLTLSSVSLYIYLRMFTPIFINSPSMKGRLSLNKPINSLFVISLMLSVVIV